jgi:hypothetical protein
MTKIVEFKPRARKTVEPPPREHYAVRVQVEHCETKPQRVLVQVQDWKPERKKRVRR